MDTTSAADAEPRPGLQRQAIGLEQFTVAWMLIEAAVAVTAGIIAGSLALTSFGFDSVIELVAVGEPTAAGSVIAAWPSVRADRRL